MIELLHSDKRHWLMVPRLAVVVIPLGVAGVVELVGYRTFTFTLISISILSLIRLVWLRVLPHERTRLAEAKHAFAAARPDETIRILQLPLRLAGAHFKLLRAALLSKAYVREGLFIDAHRTLNAVDAKTLLPDESMVLCRSWAQLFLAAGNLEEAARRLDGVATNFCAEDAECLLAKALLELERGNAAEARGLLEAGLDRNPGGEFRVMLLNNLATVELSQGRTDTQLRHLQAALGAFRNSPRADLTAILHHNLAIALVRAGQPGEAREVLREAWAAGGATNLRHVLEVLNNHLHSAREAGDAGWKREVYEEFERQLGRFKSISPREQLALAVSQLRMRRNDGIPFEFSAYTVLIERSLDVLDQSHLTISESESVAALSEISHDLKRELETQAAPNATALLRALLRRACAQMLGKQAVVDAHLNTLSPKLTGRMDTWHRYRTTIDKAEILLAEGPDATRIESPRDSWRPFGLSQAGMAWLASCR